MGREIKIPEGWEVRKLGEIAEINPKEILKKRSIYPFIDMASVPENKRLPENIFYKEYKGSGSKFRKNDILFSRITPCLENGKTAYLKNFLENNVGFGSTEFIVIRRKKNISNSLFLYYLVRWDTFRENARKEMSGTSGRQRVSPQALSNIDVPCPPLPEQEKIAEILGSIDDQIENLTEQNKTLEEIAKTIFKRWFIDFEFPNEEGKPYKSSGGEFVDSELGRIPKGWK
ncbi:restriction endonuclease subunit S, partial [Thermovibrio sp.]